MSTLLVCRVTKKTTVEVDAHPYIAGVGRSDPTEVSLERLPHLSPWPKVRYESKPLFYKVKVAVIKLVE